MFGLGQAAVNGSAKRWPVELVGLEIAEYFEASLADAHAEFDSGSATAEILLPGE